MMLKAMLRSCSDDKTALLVLACHMPSNTGETPTGETPTGETPLPSLDIADKLKLLDTSHPWQV